MSKRLKRRHIAQLCTHFELACLFGAWICGIDLFWLVHDIHSNGLSLHYIVVGTGLFVGLAGTTVALVKHHREEFKAYRKQLLADKIKANKHHK